MFQHFQAMKTSGTMDGAYFVSRQELLTYVNSALNTNEYTKVEQCGNGVAYLLMLHDILTSLAHAESLLAPLPSQQRPYHPPPPAPLPPGSPVPFGPAAAAGGSAFDGWQAGSAGTAGALGGGGGLRTPLTGGGSVVSFRGAAGSSCISAGAPGGGSVAGGKPNPLLALAGAIMTRMKKRARSEFEATHNLKLLQDMLGRLGVQRAVEVDKLARGVYQANLEFLQWFVRFAKNAKANEEAVLMQQSYPQQAAAIAATTTTASATRASSSQNAGVSPSGGSTFRQPSPSGQRSTSAFALDPQPQQDPPPPFRSHHSQQGGSARSGVVAAPAPTSDVMGSSVSSMPTLHAATVAFTAPVDDTFLAGGVSGGPLSGRVGSSASGAMSNPTSGRQQQQMGESGPHFHAVHAGPSVGPVVASSSVGFSGRAHSMNSNSGNTFTDPMNPVVPLLNTSTASARSSVSRTSGHAESTTVGSRLPPPAYQHQQQRPHPHHQTPPSVPAMSSVPPPAHISTMGTTTTYHTDSISIDVGGAMVGSAAHNGGGGLFSASSSTYGPLDPPSGVMAGSSRGLLGSGGLTMEENHNTNFALPGNVGIVVEEGVPAPHRPPLLHQHGQARRALNAETAGALHPHQQQVPQQLRGNRSPSGRSARSIGSARSPSPSSPMGLGALQTTTGVSGVVSYHRNQSAASNNGVQRQHSLSGSPRTSQQHLLNQRLFVGAGGAEGLRRESVDYVGGSVELRATSLDLVGEPPVAASSRMMMMSGRVSSSAAVSASNVSISDAATPHEGGRVGGGAGGIMMRGGIGGAVAVGGGVAAFSDELTDAPLRPSSSRSTSATDRGAAPKVNSDNNNVRSAVLTSLFGVSSGATSQPQQQRASISVTSHSSYQTAQPLSLNQQTILSDDGEDMLVMTRPGGVARSPVPHAAVAPPRPITTSSGVAAATVVAPPVVAAAPGVATNASTAGAAVTTSVTATRTATNPPTISGGSVVSSVSGGPLRGVPLATAPLGSVTAADDVKAKDSALVSKAIVASTTAVKPGAPVPRSFTFEQKTHPPTRPVDAPLASTSPLTGGGVVGGNTATITPAATSTSAARTVSASSAGLVPSTVFKSAPPPPALSTIISSSSSSQGAATVAAAAASGKSTAAITPPLVPIAAPPTSSLASTSTSNAAVPVLTASSNTAEIQARFYYDKLRAIELLVCDPQRTAALCGSSIGVVSARPLLAEITKILHAA